MHKIELGLRNEILKLMLEKVKEELEYEFHGDKQWIYGMSLNIKELDEIIQSKNYDYTIATKVIIKMDGSDLVDGAIVQYDIETKDGEVEIEINLGFTEENPAYNGGIVQDAIKWLSKNEYSGGNELIYLNMRDEKYSSYKSY